MLPFDQREGVIWFNGEFVPWADAKIHVLTHALHYASAVFEGERAYGGEIFKLTEHTQRLFDSARMLDMKIPYTVEEIAALIEAGEGAPGRAIAFRGLDIAALDRAMDELAREGDPTNARRAALAQSLALKSAQPRYEAFLARAPSRIAEAAKSRRGAALADAVALWQRATALAGNARRLSLDPQSTVFELAGMLAALAQNRRSDAA